MSAIQNFAFDDHLVRSIERDGEPWFVGKDVCECLDLKNYRTSLDLLDDDEKGVHSMDTLGGNQTMIIINEAGVYRLVFRSRKPEAERFKRWLAHEVLPQIRRTGEYRPANADATADDDQPIASQRLALSMITEARLLYGPARARALWEKLGVLPTVPMSPARLAAEDDGVPVQVLECLGHLAEWPADEDLRTVIEIVRNPDETGRAALETLGIRLAPGGMWIAAGKPEMREVWANTRWRDGLWASLLKKLPGVTGNHERISIGGYQCRPIWFPAAALR